MGKALLRLEDIGPGGYYESAENGAKLLVVASRLKTSGIPFQAAVIPRFVDPGRRYDRSIADLADPEAARFVHLLHGLVRCGASLGMHGYTHQYGHSVSGEGNEFADASCRQDCPPDDPPSALADPAAFRQSYAFGRFHSALTAFRAAGLRAEWFESPHYVASEVQRRILDACSGVIHETNPDFPESRRVTLRPSLSARGWTAYVPTPLGYVGGSSVDRDVDRILHAASEYGEEELASFFYHPFLEFPYIRRDSGGRWRYGANSPLHRLTGGFGRLGRRFVSIRELTR
ncbi:DUF2334 domain-containing protein [Cohnella caldifontis]|uniref:DUF2334 domain-containing protein n=1 Tax=Cohnella caldifontis TaxID=3027471 RepID=UPI0023EAF44F|nr:DUF2334 domain-containing protein [Cohnella sp. YIM B05605]